MTDLDREFIARKNLADRDIRAAAAGQPVETVEIDDEARDRSETFGVYEAGGVRFADKIEEKPLSVKIGLPGFADDEQAREEAGARGLKSESVRMDDKGRFLAADEAGAEFFIGRRLRAGEQPQTLGSRDVKGPKTDEASVEGKKGIPEPQFQSMTPQQRFQSTSRGEGREELPTEPPSLERAGDVALGVAETIFETAAGFERGVNVGLLEAAKAMSLLTKADAETLLKRFPVPRPSGTAGQVSETAGRVAGPALPFFALFQAAGMGAVTASVLAEAVGSGLGLDPNDPNISNLIPENSQDAFVAGLRDILATDPKSREFTNRARIFAENFALGTAFVGTLKVVAKINQLSPDQLREMFKQAGVPATMVLAATDEPAPSDADTAGAGPILRGLRRVRPVAPRAPPPGVMADPRTGPVTIRPARPDESDDFLRGVTGQDPGIGIDFNFNNINTTDELKQALNQVSTQLAPQIDEAKRGVVKQSVTRDLAEQMDMLPKVLQRNVGETFNAEQIVAARMMLAKSAERLDRLAQNATGATASELDMLAFRKHMAFHAALQMQIKGAQTEIARALASFRIPVGPEGRLDDRMVTTLLDEFGGHKTTKQLAERYLQIEDAAQRNKFASGSFFAKSRDAFFEVWINGLLSGPFTHVRNIVGNTLFQSWSIPENAIAATLGATRSAMSRDIVTDRVFAVDVAARAYGTIQGFRDGMVAFSKALRTGEPQDQLSKIETMRHRAISANTFGLTGPTGKAVDLLGAGIRVPGHFLMAEDEFFKAVASRMELNQLAAREGMLAKLGGATDQEATDAVMNTLRNPPPDIIKSVEDAARYYTFTDEPVGNINNMLVAMQRIPMAGRIVMPFRRTPLNIFRRFGERSPFAVMMPSVWRNIKAGGIQRDMAIARIGLGSMVMGTAAAWAADGTVTGRGPRNPQQRRQLRETGWQPWSIKVPKTGGWVSRQTLERLKSIGAVSEGADSIYISYLGIEPIGNMLAVAAGTADALKWSDEFNRNEDLATVAVGSAAEAMGDRSFMTGFAQLTDALQFGPNAFNRYISNLAASMKPFSALVRQINRASDHTLRDTRVDPELPIGISQFWAFRNGWMRDTPGLGTDLPPVRNLWGDEVKLGQGRWFDLVNPFYISPREYAPVDTELVRLGTPIQLPDRKIGNVRLKPDEYSRYVELQGRGVVINGMSQKEALDMLFNSTFYIDATDDQKTGMVRNVHRDYLNEARRQLAGYSVRTFRGQRFQNVDLGAAENADLAIRLQESIDKEKELPPAALPPF